MDLAATTYMFKNRKICPCSCPIGSVLQNVYSLMHEYCIVPEFMVSIAKRHMLREVYMHDLSDMYCLLAVLSPLGI